MVQKALNLVDGADSSVPQTDHMGPLPVQNNLQVSQVSHRAGLVQGNNAFQRRSFSTTPFMLDKKGNKRVQLALTGVALKDAEEVSLYLPAAKAKS